ncbi:MAG: hypothetical protein IKR52_00765 [Paludibacteraceae bacterium]|nr:hypothetical protein [Paludibacteraceae bacterium]
MDTKEFYFPDWDVELIQEPNRLREVLRSLSLEGRKIKGLAVCSGCFNFCNMYDLLEGNIDLLEESREWIERNRLLNREVEIDAPVIIYFEDGDRLEIDYSESSTLKIGMNSQPKDFGDVEDVNIVFSVCLGKTIIGTEVEESDELIHFTGSYGIEKPKNQDTYISAFKIFLSDSLALKFTSWYDYGHVSVVETKDQKESVVEMTLKELKAWLIENPQYLMEIPQYLNE